MAFERDIHMAKQAEKEHRYSGGGMGMDAEDAQAVIDQIKANRARRAKALEDTEAIVHLENLVRYFSASGNYPQALKHLLEPAHEYLHSKGVTDL